MAGLGHDDRTQDPSLTLGMTTELTLGMTTELTLGMTTELTLGMTTEPKQRFSSLPVPDRIRFR